MCEEFYADSNHPVQTCALLASGYDELTRVDAALREAERKLAAAHRLGAEQARPAQATEHYLEILALRDRTRQVLTELGEIWVADR